MNDDIIQKILSLSISYNNSEICEMVGFSREKIRKTLLDFGIVNDRKSSIHRSIVLYLSKTGKDKTNKEISSIFNVSSDTVSNIKKRTWYSSSSYYKGTNL